MKKIMLSAAISIAAINPALADGQKVYSGTATSGTAADPMASFQSVVGSTSVSMFYVDPASGTAANKTTAAIQLTKSTDWDFYFYPDHHTVDFAGNIYLGNYTTQTNIFLAGPTSPSTDGRQTYTNDLLHVSGTGTFDETTNTFTYSYLNSTINGGGGASLRSNAARRV